MRKKLKDILSFYNRINIIPLTTEVHNNVVYALEKIHKFLGRRLKPVLQLN